MHVFIWHKWKGMLTWNRSLKMKHLKKGGKIYYQWNHESIYVINFVSHKNDFDDSNLKWVLLKSWSWFFSWMIVTCIPCIHDMIFMQFFVFMKYLSHHPIISFQYSSSDDMNAWDIHEFILMYANEKFRSCMVGCNGTN